MRLTVYTDYALRLLIHVAAKAPAQSTIAEVALAYGISRSHLMKIVQQLGAVGILQTVRGKGGGLRLGVDPARIRIGDIVRQTEPDMALLPCFDPIDDECVIESRCRLAVAMRQALSAFMDVLDECTLADLIRPRAPLRALLGLDDPTAGHGAHGTVSRALSVQPRRIIAITPVRTTSADRAPVRPAKRRASAPNARPTRRRSRKT